MASINTCTAMHFAPRHYYSRLHLNLNVFLVAFLLVSVSSFGQNVINGSFTDMTGNSITPSGWNNVLGYNPGTTLGVSPSVDVLDINFTAYFNNAAVSVSPSPDGGTWTGLSSIPPDFENEAIEQLVTGFTVGQYYQLTFYAANFGGTPFVDPGVVTAYVNGVPVAVSPTLDLAPNTWTTVTGTFVATASSLPVQMDVIHNTGDVGVGGYYSVDGLTIVPIANPCNAGNTAPNLNQTSTCLASGTFNLNTITASNQPAGTTLNWHTSATPTASNLVASPGSVSYGTYYAAFYDAGFNCYSPATPFQVNAVPTPSFSAPDVCSNQLMVFTDQSTLSPGTITGWNWDFGDGNNATIQSPSHLYSSNSSYTVTLNVTGTGNCSASTTQTIHTLPTPVANFSALASCANDPVIFTDQSTISQGTITSWSWNFGDGNTSTSASTTHQYSNSSSYSVTLTVFSDLGCYASTTQQVSTTSPIAAFSVTSACTGNPTVFTDQSTLSAGTIATWNWDFGDGNTSTVQSPSHNYSASGTYTVSLTVASSQGCTNTHTQPITIYSPPVAGFIAPTACTGIPLSFTDQSVINAGSISSWSWNFGDGTSSSATSPVHLYGSSTGATYNVSLTVTSDQGCSNTYTQPVTTITTPDASFNFMPVQPDILHTEVHFTNTTTGATSYNWNFGNAGNSTQTNPVFQFPENAEFYTIQLIALNGVCSDTTYRSLQIRDVLIYYIPNCFTPDGNQFNQVFQPVFHNGIDPYDFNMQIYNRWGEVIFESRDPSAGWDGTYHGSLVQDGMYSWRIEFKTLLSDERIIETGHVNKLQ